MSYSESVQRAIDYIETHLEEELDLSAIADEAYLSVAQLYRVFCALTGHPVKEYIRKRRISVAAGLLRTSDRTVETIAWDSGFESYQSFARVFKKIAGMTPAAYRKADIYFSFEPIRLQERVVYRKDREHSKRFPDVKVMRLMPMKMYAYLHESNQEAGMENEAFRHVFEKTGHKFRIFGHNVDMPDEKGKSRFGYRVLIADEGDLLNESLFPETSFEGGLYAVRKIAASPPEYVQEGWNRLLAEWLPMSAFDIGTHQYLEEFIAYNGKVARMHLYLPVQRKARHESIRIVELAEKKAFFCRGYGEGAQRIAEKRLIDWHNGHYGNELPGSHGKYFMSYCYGASDPDEYWWENGILTEASASRGWSGLEEKHFGYGAYVSCVSKTYGLLTGVLDKLHRWIAASGRCRLDDSRQWFAEYHTFDGRDIERDSIIHVYVPIIQGEC